VSGVHRLDDGAGTSGVLAPQGPWSLEVRDLDGPDVAGWLGSATRHAQQAGALDLRSSRPLPGFAPVTEAEHVLPVPTRLDGPAATRELGRRLAAALRAGDLVVLSGRLGAGKTTLVQGLGEALGVRGRVTSPTFVLARQHRGPLPLMHVDAYRVRDTAGGGEALVDLDLEGWLESGVVVVEWGEGVVDEVSADRLEVRLDRTRGGGEDERTVLVRPHGSRWHVL
jgi:tRNA threonylcarbamoyladenosine biosynthesis protein TsaE